MPRTLCFPAKDSILPQCCFLFYPDPRGPQRQLERRTSQCNTHGKGTRTYGQITMNGHLNLVPEDFLSRFHRGHIICAWGRIYLRQECRRLTSEIHPDISLGPEAPVHEGKRRYRQHPAQLHERQVYDAMAAGNGTGRAYYSVLSPVPRRGRTSAFVSIDTAQNNVVSRTSRFITSKFASS